MIDRTKVHVTAYIHEAATVENAAIGARSRVYQAASVIRQAVVGDDCTVASCAIVDGSRIGDRCIISHGAFIDPGMRIGNDVFIGPHVSLCNDIWPRVSKAGWFAMADLVSGEITVTLIADGASIGANAVLMPGLRIGERAMVAAGAVVTRNVPADFLCRRDGTMVPIDEGKAINRKRACADDYRG